MAWKVEFSPVAERELEKLDKQHVRRILKFLYERVGKSENPQSIGQALRGSELGEFWKYRIGPFRIICKLLDERLLVVVVRVGDRKEVYR